LTHTQGGYDWNTRQTGSGEGAGVTGIQPGNSRRSGKTPFEKGLITEFEFMQKLSAERAVYQELLKNVR